jgi:hypothetical protein
MIRIHAFDIGANLGRAPPHAYLASAPMPSWAGPKAPPPNSPKPGGWPAKVLFEHRQDEGHSILGRADHPGPDEARYFAGLRKAGVPEE